MGKRKPKSGAQKLTEFFRAASTPAIQDGIGSSAASVHNGQSGKQGRNASKTQGSYAGTARYSNNSTPFSSPQKSKMRHSYELMDAGEHTGEDSISNDDTRELVDILEEFPTHGQAINNTTMLISLKGSLHKEVFYGPN